MLELLSSVWNVVWIVLAFSVLVFVHELGHFLAALLVGVRPERFFIGFDVYGLGIKKEYKGCVYGIGLLPLGGYVKLAGQSDDPREQKNGAAAADDYRSKPLWAQATIITAGVIMNMIFGFLLLFFLYYHGLPQVPPVVGVVSEGSVAAMAGIQSGDRILSINGGKIESLGQVHEYIVVNPRAFYELEIERAGATLHRRLKAQGEELGLDAVGLNRPAEVVVKDFNKNLPFSDAYSKLLQEGDVFVEVAGQKLPSGIGLGDVLLTKIISENPGRGIPAVVLRDGKRVEISLPVLGVGSYDFGYAAQVEIGGVIAGSPAGKAGLTSGDTITAVILDGQKVDLLDSKDLSDKIRSRAYQSVNLTILRDGQEQVVTLIPRFMGGLPQVQAGEDTLLGVTVEPILNGAGQPSGWRVESVLADGPAVKILKSGDALVAVNGQKLAAPEGVKPEEFFRSATNLGEIIAATCCKEIGLVVEGKNKPLLLKPGLSLDTGVPLIGIMMNPFTVVGRVKAGTPAALFLAPGDMIVSILVSPDGKSTTVSYVGSDRSQRKPYTFKTPDAVTQGLRQASGGQLEGAVNIIFNPSKGVKKSIGVVGALQMAGAKTVDMSLTVYKILHRLVTRQISVKNMSGPVGIYRVMQQTTESDDPMMGIILLMALISINLAIFNLLPFPVLDGGHLLFIVVEWIKGTPPSERFRELSQYFGIICLLGLMALVTINDVSRWVSDATTKSVIENSAGNPK